MSEPSMTETSLGSWLLPRSRDTQARLERVVAQASVNRESARPLRTLGVVARRALAEEIEAKLRMVLSETLADLVLGGWHTYGAITEAVGKSRTRPGVEQIVPLRDHVITVDRTHNLDIEVDRFPVLSLAAEAQVRLQLFAAVAVVRDGHVVEIRSGQASANGILSVDRVDVSRKTLTFPLDAKLVQRRQPQAVVAAS